MMRHSPAEDADYAPIVEEDNEAEPNLSAERKAALERIEAISVLGDGSLLYRCTASTKLRLDRLSQSVTNNPVFEALMATGSCVAVLGGTASQCSVVYELFRLGHPIWGSQAILYHVIPYLIFVVLTRLMGIDRICARCRILGHSVWAATAIYAVMALPMAVAADLASRLYFLGRVPTDAMVRDAMELRKILGVPASCLSTTLQGYILLRQRLGMPHTPNVDWRLLTVSVGMSSVSLITVWRWLGRFARLETNGSKWLLVKHMANFGESIVPTVLLDRLLSKRHVACPYDLGACSKGGLKAIGEAVRRSEVLQTLTFTNSMWVRQWCERHSTSTFKSALLQGILQNAACLELVSFDEALPKDVQEYFSSNIDGHMSLQSVIVQGSDVALNEFLQEFHNLPPCLQSAWRGDVAYFQDAPSVDMDTADRAGNAAILIAASRGHAAVVKQLLLASEGAIRQRNRKQQDALTVACREGKVQCVQLLLAAGSDPTTVDQGGMSALMHACRRSREEVVEALLRSRARVSQLDSNQNSALHHTLSNFDDEVELLRLLLLSAEASGLDGEGLCQLVNARTKTLQTPLMMAAAQGQSLSLQELMQRRADIASRDRWGQSALHQAALNSRFDAAQVLLDQSAPIDLQDKNGQTPLFNAAAHGPFDLVAALLERGANVGITRHDGQTPLHGAAGRFSADALATKLARALLGARACTNSVQKRTGETPLLAALRAGNTNTASLLIQMSAEMDVSDYANKSTLMNIAEGGDPALLESFLQRRCNLNAYSNNGWTPLRWAIKGNHTRMVTALLARRADPRPRQIGSEMRTPVAHAAQAGGVEMLEVLWASKADFNARDASGWSPLMLALRSDRRDNAGWLLEHGADPSTANVYGTTPLGWVAAQGYLPTARALLEARADVNSTDVHGFCPLIYSLDFGRAYEDVAILLLEATADVQMEQIRALALLHAASNCMPRVARRLLEQRADVNVAHEHRFRGGGPLLSALSSTHATSEMVELLLQSSARVDQADGRGWSPLAQAVKGRHMTIVKKLLHGRADPMASAFGVQGLTAIHLAFLSGASETGERLMQEAQAQLTVADLEVAQRLDGLLHTGRTLLHLAARSGSIEMMKRALALKADVNGQDFTERTPIAVAAGCGKSEAVLWLLERNADPGAKDASGETVLDHAITGQCSLACCRRLREAGGSFSTDGEPNGITTLHDASGAGRSDVLQFVLEADGMVMLEARQLQGSTPLMYAALQVNVDAMQLLVQARARVDATEGYNNTVLHEALDAKFKGDTEQRAASSPLQAVTLLLEERVDVHNRGDFDLDAFRLAVDSENVELMQLLFERRADIQRQGPGLRLPAHIAAQRGVELTQWFLNRGSSLKVQDGDGMTLAHRAAGSVEALELLLARRADLLLRSFTWETPLHAAARGGSAVACRYLLRQHADPLQEDANGVSPLACAASNLDTMRVLSAGCSFQSLLRLQSDGRSIASQVLAKGNLASALWLLQWSEDAGIQLDLSARDDAGRTVLMDNAANVSKLPRLVELRADARVRDHEDSTALLVATGGRNRGGARACAQMLVREGAEVNAANFWGMTPFLKAVSAGDYHLAKWLITRGADVTAQDLGGNGALHHAVAANDEECLLWLLRMNAHNIEDENKNGLTPFLKAVSENNLGLAKLLLHHRANLHHEDVGRRNALWWAMHAAGVEDIRFLMRAGARAQEDLCGRGPLLQLMATDPNKVGESFISRIGAGDVNGANAWGLTPLAAASRKALPRIIRALLHLRADASAPDVNGQTALHHAAADDGAARTEVYELLISAGVAVNARCHQAKTPLMWAARAGRQVSVEFLLRARAEVNATDKLGRAPVHHGAGSRGVTQKLLEARGTLGSVDSEGSSVLVHAVTAGNTLAVQCLLDSSADPRLAAVDGSLAFHHAAAGGHLQILRLLPHFAVPDLDGWSPIYHAAVNGRTEVVHAFEKQICGDGCLAAEMEKCGNGRWQFLSALASLQEAMRNGRMGVALGRVRSFPEWNDFDGSLPVEMIDARPGNWASARLEGARALHKGDVQLGLPSFGKASGKWHIELCVFGFSNMKVGFADARHRAMGATPGTVPTSWTVALAAKRRYHDAELDGEAWRCPPWMRRCPQRVGMAIDIDARRLFVTADGTWHEAFAGIDFQGQVYPLVSAARGALIFHVKNLHFAPPDSAYRTYDGPEPEAPQRTTPRQTRGRSLPLSLRGAKLPGYPRQGSAPRSAGRHSQDP